MREYKPKDNKRNKRREERREEKHRTKCGVCSERRRRGLEPQPKDPESVTIPAHSI